jgi:hypothetical protein
MLAKEPAARYASPGAVAEALRPLAAPAAAPRRRKRLPRLAGLAALVLIGLALTVPIAFRTSVGPQVRVVSLRVSHHRGQQAGFVGDLGLTSSAARVEDDVRLEAQLSGPAYCYLFALNPDGKAQLCHPRNEADPPPQVVGLEYPADPDTYFGLTDGTGVQAFVLVASRAPLPSFAAWQAAAGMPTWERFQADGVWRYADGRFCRIDVARGAERVRGVPPALQQLADFLRQHAGGGTVAAIAFPVEPAPPASANSDRSEQKP